MGMTLLLFRYNVPYASLHVTARAREGHKLTGVATYAQVPCFCTIFGGFACTLRRSSPC